MNKSLIIFSVILVIILGAIFTVNRQSNTNTQQVANNQNTAVETDSLISSNETDLAEERIFTGEKGDVVKIENQQITIATSGFETDKLRYFNTTLPDGKTVYFLILKDDKGIFRAAANGHEKCANYNKGHTQEGDKILCSVCKDSVFVNDFAVDDKKDCSPKSINPNLAVQNNQLIINSSELEKIAYLF